MIKKQLASAVNSIASTFGLQISRVRNEKRYPPDFSPQAQTICDTVGPYTMTSPERVNALINAVNYVVNHKIEGAFVECGVWRGGSSMAMIMALQALGAQNRELYLYDTYAGMNAPTEEDVSITGGKASKKFSETMISEDSSEWCYSPLDEVKQNVLSTGYPQEQVRFIVGKVEETIPAEIPDEIALLRLDTDWYESTKHEMIHLFPRLKKNGVLIIDDYGHWEGARKAIDEYLTAHDVPLLLNRIDYTGRIAIKS